MQMTWQGLNDSKEEHCVLKLRLHNMVVTWRLKRAYGANRHHFLPNTHTYTHTLSQVSMWPNTHTSPWLLL